MEHAKAEKWDILQEDIISLNKAWQKIIPRIQFSVELDEIHNITLNIARLRGFIDSEDGPGTLVELNEIIENWDELSR